MKRRDLTEEEQGEAERLAHVWAEYKAANKGATQEWLGSETGLGTQGAVGQYLRGVIPLNLDALLALSRVIGADPMFISPRLAGKIQAVMMKAMPAQVAEPGDPGTIFIPRVALRLSAGITGFDTQPDRRDGGQFPLPRNWVERKGFNQAALLAIEVEGASMETSLHDGDIVIINTADKRPVEGKVFAVNYDGESVVKRMQRDAGDWWLTSDNPDQRKYHRKVCRGDACIIIGRVVRKESEEI